MTNLQIPKGLKDGQTVAEFAAQLLLNELGIGTHSNETILALAGGATPEALYRILSASSEFLEKRAPRIHFLLGDERFVPETSEDSNYRMAYEALLHAVPTERIHKIPTNVATPVESANLYEAELTSITGSKILRLDVVLLGIGSDGHTASLFPGTPAVALANRTCVVCTPPSYVKPAVDRISLSRDAICSAQNVVLMAVGESKARPIATILSEQVTMENGETSVAASILRECRGKVYILADEAALSF